MLWEAVKLATLTIRRNALRSFLTMLGIVIGVGAVIAMVTIGNGTTAQVEADVAKLGTNLLTVRAGQVRHGPGGVRTAANPFTVKDTEAIESQITGIRAIAPTSTRNTTAIYGSANWKTPLTGTDNQYFLARQWVIEAGHNFSERDIKAGKSVCIIGATVREQLFAAADPLGAKIRLKKVSCQVVGVLKAKGQGSFGGDQDDTIIVPLRMFQRRISGNRDISRIYIAVQEGIATAKIKQDVEALLRERRHIQPGKDDNFFVFDTAEMASTLAGITNVLTGLLGAVAAVSLLVGGIGIMNIMLVSVTERTREIGIRLAIGALESQVMAQFLVEAIALSLLGGVVGIGFGLGLAALAVSFLNVPFIFDPGIVAIAFVFSAAIGVIFGYFPALRAARLNPIEALRHE